MSRAETGRVEAPAIVALQVGRSGEIAGGMTQVINGYLAWPFERVRVRVLTSRDGTHGARALMIFAKALRRTLVMRGRDRVVFVVHLSQSGSFVREGLLLRIAARRGFATVAQLHGSSFAEFAARNPGRVRAVLSKTTRVIALSDESAELAARFTPAERVLLVPNAVPVGSPSPRPSKTVVFGGAVTTRKGVDVLIEAWRRIGQSSGWTLIVAGPQLEPDIVPAELPGAEFVGAVPHERLMELLDSSAIAVLPSRDEAMPMFILEALARDNCVISTPVGGIAAVLGEGRGMLVAPGDVDELADALRLAMTDDTTRSAVAASGRAAFDAEFSAATVYPRIEQVWLDALAERTAH